MSDPLASSAAGLDAGRADVRRLGDRTAGDVAGTAPALRDGSRRGLIKVGLSAALIGLLVMSVDHRQLVGVLAGMSPLPFLAAVILFMLQCVLAGLRCSQIVGPSWPVSLPEHVRLFWIGQFFNQLLPSTVGGDAVRVWMLARFGPPLATALKLTLVDRLVGVVCLMLLIVLTAGLPDASRMLGLQTAQLLLMVVIAALLGLALVLILVGSVPGLKRVALLKPAVAVAEELIRLITTPGVGLQVLALAMMVHACSIGAFWLSATAVGAALSLLDAALVTLPMLLIAMVPVSVAGWGVREGVVVVGLGHLGLPAEVALSAGVLFGLALLVASLPGSVFWRREPVRHDLAGGPSTSLAKDRDLG